MNDPLIDDIFVKALQNLLEAQCPPAVVRAIELESSGSVAPSAPSDASDASNASTSAKTGVWQAIADSGFANAMVPESLGGAGLSMAQAFALFEVCGRYVLPLPLPETMLARAWAAQCGLDAPDHCIDLDWLDASAQAMPQLPGLEARPDTRAMRAALLAAQMAGAMQRVLEMTLQYANDRQQFGRALGKFQAIQHQLAQMAEQAMAARMAAQMGCRPPAQGPALQPSRLRAGIAKARACEAAVVVTDLAHSIHGAIGFTEAFDLQLYTRRLHTWRQRAGAESYWHNVVGDALVNQHDGHALDLLRAA
jgi:acyl-CoA dehydrogenase